MTKHDIVVDATQDNAKVSESSTDDGLAKIIEKTPLDDSVSWAVVSDPGGKKDTVAWIKVGDAAGVERAIQLSAGDYAFTIIECSNWKVIPLENLVAEFSRRGKKLYALVNEPSDLPLALSILERGVDGVVVPPQLVNEAKSLLRIADGVDLVCVKVTKILDARVGDRICVDTTSHLRPGEGMLVGSKGGFLFLVHGETLKNEYIPTRPFRVNAGAVHSYVLTEARRTKYLSELSAGDGVLLVQHRGETREAVVGRVKIERRPMVLIEAQSGETIGSVILQNAETVRLVKANGEPISVMELKPGEEILAMVDSAHGRHLGGEVDEFIIER